MSATVFHGKDSIRVEEVVRAKRVHLAPLLTHKFSLDQIPDAYKLFGNRTDGVMKVMIRP